MIFDRTLKLSDAQAITSTAVSTNIYDQGAAGTVFKAASPLLQDLGKGGKLPFLAQVVTTMTAAGAATLQFQIQTATDAAFTSPVNLYTSEAIPVASLVAGYQMAMDVMIRRTLRFIRMNYIVATGPMTAGAVTCGFVAAVQTAGNIT
jgi:hypothetical protein